MNEVDVEAIKKRNARVEEEKAWETCWTRRLCIAVFTYIVAFIYMNYVGLSNPILGAFVPAGGYLLSTLSIPFAKNFWLNNIYKKKES